MSSIQADYIISPFYPSPELVSLVNEFVVEKRPKDGDSSKESIRRL